MAVPLRVALTRQEGQNGKLRRALGAALERSGLPSEGFELAELPCIEHGEGDDFPSLVARLGAGASGASLPDVAVLTSPEAARTFLRAWEAARPGEPVALPIASVGRGTSAVLEAAGAAVAFEPSLANAEALAAEMPKGLGRRALYAASGIAPGTLQEGLERRGFEVERLNTYTTRPVQDFGSAALSSMRGTDVVTFGSPSAVRAWTQHAGSGAVAACIGGTSRDAAEKAGFQRIFSPAAPGIEGWADATVEAVRELLKAKAP